jgi:hypothetical protein
MCFQGEFHFEEKWTVVSLFITISLLQIAKKNPKEGCKQWIESRFFTSKHYLNLKIIRYFIFGRKCNLHITRYFNVTYIPKIHEGNLA